MKKKLFFSLVILSLMAFLTFGLNFKIKADVPAYSCTVTTSCPGGSISCTGDVKCSRTATSVTCDGNTTNC